MKNSINIDKIHTNKLSPERFKSEIFKTEQEIRPQPCENLIRLMSFQFKNFSIVNFQ